MNLKASIVVIGDEILIGQITDTNSSMIARRLGEEGIVLRRITAIGDNADEIRSTLLKELDNSDIVVTTGGLGPTRDDITKAVIADISGSKGYVSHADQMEVIRRLLHSRGLEVLDVNRAQADVPDRCEVIVNRLGTAPILVTRTPQGHVMYNMPGVPFETEAALADVCRDIHEHFGSSPITHLNIMTYGLPESALADRISAWEDSLAADGIHLAYLPNVLTGVKLRLSVYGDADADAKLEAAASGLKGLIGEYIYAFREDTLENRLGEVLKEKGLTLAVAESCTGGEISHLVTSVPGSSAYYLGSVTSYAVPVKESLLGVAPEIIEHHGVVSAETAAAMAVGVHRALKSDCALATTGFAGPGGGNDRYPEGTVWVGAYVDGKVSTRMFSYRSNRLQNIRRFASSAIYFLLQQLTGGKMY